MSVGVELHAARAMRRAPIFRASRAHPAEWKRSQREKSEKKLQRLS